MSETNRKFMLEQMSKEIDKELGRGGDKALDTLTARVAHLATLVPNHVAQETLDTITTELDKLSSLDKSSSDYNITKNYLTHVTKFPWGHTTPTKNDVSFAKEILDREHYGLDDVKNAILQYVAVDNLNSSLSEPPSPGKIICLVGPPGVGKTSIGKSIAESLSREFYRFSVGGLSDVSEIKGHRRTYVGAMPGKIISGIATAKSLNPVVLIDEIDKLGSVGRNGDPASALLEVLDPSQVSSLSLSHTHLDQRLCERLCERLCSHCMLARTPPSATTTSTCPWTCPRCCSCARRTRSIRSQARSATAWKSSGSRATTCRRRSRSLPST